jgi:hypothetical protein
MADMVIRERSNTMKCQTSRHIENQLIQHFRHIEPEEIARACGLT